MFSLIAFQIKSKLIKRNSKFSKIQVFWGTNTYSLVYNDVSDDRPTS
jgi:hypothetical protein